MDSVCLVIPPSVFLLDERVFMSLGILKVAAVLEARGIPVEVLDLSGIDNFKDATADYAAVTEAKIFGITATTPQLPATARITETIRGVRPDARLIIGGPHATLVNAAYKRERIHGVSGRATSAMDQLMDMFDVVVAGDGEDAMFLALAPDAPRLVDADDPRSPLFLTNDRLTELPFPARHLVDVESYHYSIEGEPALSMIAQLGCPFGCGFCGGRDSAMLRRIRMRSAQSIVDEMVHLHRTYNCNAFMLYDDELNVNKGMVDLMHRIADAQEHLGVSWKLRGFVKAELFTDDQAAAMYRAGFRWILTGFESGSERILKNINKNATRSENTRCVEIARRHNLKVKALMSIGHAGETSETVADTEKWLAEAVPDDFDVSIITCYPGTPYYDRAVRHATIPGVWTYTYEKTGDRLHQVEVDYARVANYYKGDPEGGYTAYVFTDALSSDDLVRMRDAVEHRIRARFGIPFNPGAPAIRYEHSMGQGMFPSFILRKSKMLPPTIGEHS